MAALINQFPLATTTNELRSGTRSLHTTIHEVCDRIDRLEPYIQALLPEPGRRERLLAEAELLQRHFPDPADRPPLYGALLGIKDILRVDGFPTQAGSQLPATLFVGPQASCVTRLCDAGALVLGKTVTAEFASDEPGPTRNPHHLEHTPGGSSSGSAAAVAAGFCSLALGTQTGGSIIRPAAFCGTIGFKPTYGRIAPDGLILHSPSLDTIGLFTQDLAGATLAASLLCTDWQQRSAQGRPVLAVPVGPYLTQATPEALACFEQQLALLKRSGYSVKQIPALTTIQSVAAHYRTLSSGEMAVVHREWFVAYETFYRPRTASKLCEGQAITQKQLAQARAGQALLRAQLEDVMRQEGIDLWLAPAALGPAQQGITSTGHATMNLPWSYAGMPALSLPAGTAANGLPIGLQIVAHAMHDEQLLAWAAPIAALFTQPQS